MACRSLTRLSQIGGGIPRKERRPKGKATRGSGGNSSCSVWKIPEEIARQRIQEFIQHTLEEEVTEFLRSRAKSQPGTSVPREPQQGYSNGYGEPRTLTLSAGTVTVGRTGEASDLVV